MPRFLYWTILLGEQPTAFRARERDELVPTLKQLQRQHPEAVLRWFERGRLWESPEAARAQFEAQRRAGALEKRGPKWRPGGEHRDPHERDRPPRDVRRRKLLQRLRERGEIPPPSRGPDDTPRPRGPKGGPPGDRPDWRGPKPGGDFRDRTGPPRPRGPKSGPPGDRPDWRGPKPGGGSRDRPRGPGRPGSPRGPKGGRGGGR